MAARLAYPETSAIAAMRRRLQMIFQDPYASLNPRWTVADIVAEPLRVHGIVREKSAVAGRVEALLRRPDIDAVVVTTPHHLHVDETVLGLAEGKHVLVIEDIIDTGKTLSVLVAELLAQRPASLAVAALLRKPEKLAVPADELGKTIYVGFDIGPEFVIGYGLDYDGLYRDLSAIYALSPA